MGTAVGDSIGLPAEGLSRRRICRMWKGSLHHRFLLGRGMISDDTEHAFFVGQALLGHSGDADRFARSLSWKLRFWFLGLPAGIGLATVKSIVRLWCGVSFRKSGVKSAGNGAAMRAPLIGLFFANDEAALEKFVKASSRITHNDERAIAGAMAMAMAAREAMLNLPDEGNFYLRLLALSDDEVWQSAIRHLAIATGQKNSVAEFADRLKCGRSVSGFVCHSVPVAIYAWLRHRHDFAMTIRECIACGGDTDTNAAMAGALSGIDVGVDGIPSEWRNGICEWPRTHSLLENMAERLAEAQTSGQSQLCVSYFWPGLVLRNVVFLVTVLMHGFRRLLPPY